VSVSETGNGLVAGALAAWLFKRPFVVIVQAPLELAIPRWLPQPLQRPAFSVHRRVSAAICVSEGLRRSVLSNWLPPGRAHVITNGIDLRALKGLATQSAAFPVQHPLVIGIGRLSAERDSTC
jgi:glycosyltransferase involved in cell wall biosynthesis